METTKPSIPIWRDERYLRVFAQVISALLVVGFIAFALYNVIRSANMRGIKLGFDFLKEAAGFPIGESLIPYDPSKSFAYAFLVGFLNTLYVSILGVILTTILGVIIGLARLSTNWLLNRLAFIYIELHRNVPLLVLLIVWYSAIFLQLPRVKESISISGIAIINQRGFYFTWVRLSETGRTFIISLGIGLAVSILILVLGSYLRKKHLTQPFDWVLAAITLITSIIFGLFLSNWQPFTIDRPYLDRFNFIGGLRLTPEYSALLIGLVTYTAAFIAEVVRAGIQSVNRGQIEAARALGLKPGKVISLVIFPQALRVIIPPLISQYLNLTKNSSLAIFIGFNELFFIGKTTINQAGRSIQVFILIMSVYLSISLLTSLILNLYNRSIQFEER